MAPRWSWRLVALTAVLVLLREIAALESNSGCPCAPRLFGNPCAPSLLEEKPWCYVDEFHCGKGSCRCQSNFLGYWDHCDEQLSSASDHEPTPSTSNAKKPGHCHESCDTCRADCCRGKYDNCLSCPEGSILAIQYTDGTGICTPKTSEEEMPGHCHPTCMTCRKDCCPKADDNCFSCDEGRVFVPVYTDGTGRCDANNSQGAPPDDGGQQDGEREDGVEQQTQQPEEDQQQQESDATERGEEEATLVASSTEDEQPPSVKESVPESGVCGTLMKRTKGGSYKKSHWTHLVFMHADNNLEMSALWDLKEMRRPLFEGQLTLVVLIDRAQGHTNSPIGRVHACPLSGLTDSTPQRDIRLQFERAYELLMVWNGESNQFEWLLLRDHGEIDMNDPDVLSSFITRSIDDFPAEHFALTLWNHGSAWAGFGEDDGNRDGRSMSLQSIVKGVRDGLTATEVHKAQQTGQGNGALPLKFAFLGFDACLMSSYNVIESLGPFTHYFMASEENEPGHGWNWRYLRPTVRAADGLRAATAYEYGESLLQGYESHVRSHPLTMSLIAIRDFNIFKKQFETLLESLYSCGGKGVSVLVQKAASQAYSLPGCRMIGLCGCIDLGDFLDKLGSALQLNQVDETLQRQVVEVRRFYSQMVLLEVDKEPYARFTGVNIFFPDSNLQVTCDQPVVGYIWQQEFFRQIRTTYSSFVKSVVNSEEGSVCWAGPSNSVTQDTTATLVDRDQDFGVHDGRLMYDASQHIYYLHARVPSTVVFSLVFKGPLMKAGSDRVFVASVGETLQSELAGGRGTELTGWWRGEVWQMSQHHLAQDSKDPRPAPPAVDGQDQLVHRSWLFATEKQREASNTKKEYVSIPFKYYRTPRDLRDGHFLEAFLELTYDRTNGQTTKTLFVSENDVLGELSFQQGGILRPILYSLPTNATDFLLQPDLSEELFLWGEPDTVGELTIRPVPLRSKEEAAAATSEDMRASGVFPSKAFLGFFAQDAFDKHQVHLAEVKLRTPPSPSSGEDGEAGDSDDSHGPHCSMEWIGDDVCDQVCNTTKYDFDGGDCFGTSGIDGTNLSLQSSTEVDSCDTCHPNADCRPVAGSEGPPFTCSCPAGFKGDGQHCQDVNECRGWSSGSGRPSRPPGSGNGSIAMVLSVGERKGTEGVCHEKAVCTNTEGSYTCECPAGYEGDGFEVCRDIDECEADRASDQPSELCPSGVSCVNTEGGYDCGCAEGYVVNGGLCEDVDECSSGLAACGQNTKCINTQGGYFCACIKGYVGDGRTCVQGQPIVVATMSVLMDVEKIKSKLGSIEAFQELFHASVARALGISHGRIKDISVDTDSTPLKIHFRVVPSKDKTLRQTEPSAAEAIVVLQQELRNPSSSLRQGNFGDYAEVAHIEDYKLEGLTEEEELGLVEKIISWVPKPIRDAIPSSVLVGLLGAIGLLLLSCLSSFLFCCLRPKKVRASAARSAVGGDTQRRTSRGGGRSGTSASSAGGSARNSRRNSRSEAARRREEEELRVAIRASLALHQQQLQHMRRDRRHTRPERALEPIVVPLPPPVPPHERSRVTLTTGRCNTDHQRGRPRRSQSSDPHPHPHRRTREPSNGHQQHHNQQPHHQQRRRRSRSAGAQPIDCLHIPPRQSEWQGLGDSTSDSDSDRILQDALQLSMETAEREEEERRTIETTLQLSAMDGDGDGGGGRGARGSGGDEVGGGGGGEAMTPTPHASAIARHRQSLSDRGTGR